MSTPIDPSLDELRALQERAYGRDADIHDHPAALARLRQLESELSAARAAGAAATASPASAARLDRPDASGNGARTIGGAPGRETWPADPDGSAHAAATADEPGAPADRWETDAAAPAAAEAQEVGPGESADSALFDAVPLQGGPELTDSAGAAGPGEAGPVVPRERGSDHPRDAVASASEPEAARPWWRRRIPLLWAGSVAVALLVGIGLTLLVQSLDAGRIGVLQEDPDAEWPGQVFGSRPEGGRQFEEFHGLTVISFAQGFGPGADQTCLYVLTAPDGSGFGGGSCGAGAFPATASLFVDAASPEELRERFAEGTALQFVLEESGVHVYAREPGIVQPTP
jgi:hypothetical protein